MDYNDAIKERLEQASEEAKYLLFATMETEKQYRWQTEGRSLTTQIVAEIAKKVEELVR